MMKLVMVLMLLLWIVGAATRMMPLADQAVARPTSPQHAYLRMLDDGALVAKP